MKWTDGMEYQLTKLPKLTIVGGHGEVVSAVSTIASTITVQEITTLLVAYLQVAQADPSESFPRFDSNKPGQTRIVSTYCCLHAASFVQMLVHN